MDIFEQITSALTVKSLCSPLGPDVPAGTTFDDLEMLVSEAGIDPLSNASRVISSDGNVIGIIWFDDYSEFDQGDAPIVDEVMQKLEPNELLGSATTILDAVEIFSSKPNRYFYVIHINAVVGIIYYSDLFKPIGRLAFLALALEIEDQALRLCQSDSVNEKCWLSISDNRKLKAIELFKSRYKREPSWGGKPKEKSLSRLLQVKRNISEIGLLIECTHLVDKATMIWKQKLIALATQADVLGFFNDLKEVRDRCAHAGGEQELLPRARLAHFVQSAKHIRSSLRQSIRTHGVYEESS